MEEGWARLLAGLGCPPAEARAACAGLVTRYSSPGRHYHTLEHVQAVCNTILALCPDAEWRPALLLAAWFHDAVYDPRAADNEERSAELARAVLPPLGLPETLVAEVVRLVLLTRTHVAEAGDRAGQVLLDADLAVLGEDEAAYDRYAAAVRREYAWVPEDAYRAGRRQVLEGFLRRPRIYLTDAMFARAEAAARRNLAREIATLRGS
jgi:predicted metal-dependent HD superfamily phosphohydrolase